MNRNRKKKTTRSSGQSASSVPSEFDASASKSKADAIEAEVVDDRDPAIIRGERFRKEGQRETVEALVVAFILALLFRAFIAEAFVIPTGSMAPTLMGAHKDVFCDRCDMNFRIGASQEVANGNFCLLYTSPSPRDLSTSRMPSSA